MKEKAQLEFDIQEMEELLNSKKGQDENLAGESPLGSDFSINAVMKYGKGMTLEISCKNGFISALSFEQAIMPYRI